VIILLKSSSFLKLLTELLFSELFTVSVFHLKSILGKNHTYLISHSILGGITTYLDKMIVMQ